MIKKILLIFFLVANGISFAQQYIEWPATVWDTVNGKKILSVTGYTDVFVRDTFGEWAAIHVSFYVQKSSIRNKTLLKNSAIFDYKYNQTGKTLDNIEISGSMQRNDSTLFISGYIYKNKLKDFTLNEIIAHKNIGFMDSVTSQVVVYNDEFLGTVIRSCETKYLLKPAKINNKIVRCLIKSTETKIDPPDLDFSESTYDLVFYPDFSEKDKFSYSKKADKFELREDYLFSIDYGCCEYENQIQLSTFPGNNVFLECSQSYCLLEIPLSDYQIFFGIKTDLNNNYKLRNKQWALNYSINGGKSGTVLFRTKSKEVADSISAHTPKIEMVNLNGNDFIENHSYYQKTELYSLKGIKDLSKINGVGVKVIFKNFHSKESKEYIILLENGMIKEKEIVVEF